MVLTVQVASPEPHEAEGEHQQDQGAGEGQNEAPELGRLLRLASPAGGTMRT